MANYKTENAGFRTLLPDADLGRPYALVGLAGLQSLMRLAGYDDARFSPTWVPGTDIENSPGWAVFGRFPGGVLRALSAVGFNAQRTRALVTVQGNCFPTNVTSPTQRCHSGSQKAFEKRNGRWIPSRAIFCAWMA